MAHRAEHEKKAGFGVVFDMDGVLIDSAEPHFLSWRQLAEENGRTVTRETFSATFGRQNRDIIPLLFGPVCEDRLVRLAERKEQIYRDLIRHNPPIVPGAVDLVRQLAQAKVAVAIGSSGPPANIQLVVQAMQIGNLVRAIVSGDDVHRGKPDPQVFTLSCERLHLPPDRCAVIEDAPVGIDAAKAAGAKAVAVLIHHPRSAFAHADLIVERLADLSVQMLEHCVFPN
jgi:beta-phosphoglucomutase